MVLCHINSYTDYFQTWWADVHDPSVLKHGEMFWGTFLKYFWQVPGTLYIMYSIIYTGISNKAVFQLKVNTNIQC